MKTLKDISVAGAFLVLFGTMAFAQQPMPGHGMMQHHPEMQKMMEDMMPQPSDAPSTRAFKEAHMKMMKGMSITFTGNANVDFARGMIPHHQGAIDMAKVVLANGDDPELRAMAEKIISDQEKEIAQMQEWLKKNAK